MNLHEILAALKEKKISAQEAEIELRSLKNEGKDQYVKFDTSIPMETQGAKQTENNDPHIFRELSQSVVKLQEVEPGIVQITMQDRVNKNTFSRKLILGLIEAFESVEANPRCKVVILTGYDSYFASGGTKEGLMDIYEGKRKFSDINIYSIAMECKVPVIAAMQGHGIGAGWSMGMFCDFPVMSRESFYTSNYMKYGFTPGAGATLIFPERFGINLAQEILFTGKQFRGSELEEKGIPFPVLQRNEVLPYAKKFAKELALSPREALVGLKELMLKSIKEKISSTYENEAKMHEKTFVNQPEVRDRIHTLFSQNTGDKANKVVTGSASDSQGDIDAEQKPLGNQAYQIADSSLLPEYQASDNAIAIIGIDGQFPKSNNLEEFWSNLAEGRDCISEIPEKRWSIDKFYSTDTNQQGKTYSKWMGALDNADKFDPLFFNISPAEAEMMDPQQRVFLESCWHCIEDSGQNPYSLSGSRCGVFVGCISGDYGQAVGEQVLDAQGLMGSATSILAARISYLLNLKGPCMAIDTACSSSLVAIAEACNSLILHNSDIALAGGVSILSGPSMHITTSKAGMLSKDGRCFTFDNRASGFVPGEGVGVVLLKRLSDAERDKDPIYGIIRGWGVNQDGKTNGITAPSVNSQIMLEKEVYNKFDIHPDTISLIEAHGTGTKLGDPIEVEALTKAFQFYTQRKNYCALGSVKSNIGHLITAAGIAGVIKVLLALKHKMLPPTINFEKLNEHIAIDNSPFYINTKLSLWKIETGSPRRAAISSFGFSGTNSHIVIEEYIPRTDSNTVSANFNQNSPVIFVLSAKNEHQLKEYAKNMVSFIASQDKLNILDMAYTLQVGRWAMDYRLAFVADSKDTILKVLKQYTSGLSESELITGKARKGKDGMMALGEDEDTKILVKTWIQKNKLKKVIELWMNGVSIDWNLLYGAPKPCRINLPAYPFERESYWLSNNAAMHKIENKEPSILSGIHPLLHQNTSNFYEQRFSSTFTGNEFFLKDHVMNGQHILPGVAYLEMVRTAVLQSVGELEGKQLNIRIKNVVWIRPFGVAEQPEQIHIKLQLEDDGEMNYKIYSTGKYDKEPIAHNQGNLELIPMEEEPDLDVETLLGQCSKNVLLPDQCYELFSGMGMEYGPGHRGIEMVYVGTGQVLARLSLPAFLSDTADQFVLHPSLLDSALQSSMGLKFDSDEEMLPGGKVPLTPSLPFALEELDILGRCTSKMWCLIRHSDGSKAGDKVNKVDIALYDDKGKICARMRKFSSRVMERKVQTDDTFDKKLTHTPAAPSVGNIMMHTVWDRIPAAKSKMFPAKEEQIIIIGGIEKEWNFIKQYYDNIKVLNIQQEDTVDAIVEKLESSGQFTHIVWIAPKAAFVSAKDEELIEGQKKGVLRLFRTIKALIGLRYDRSDLGWSIITYQVLPIVKGETINPTHSSIHGLVGCMAKEYPNWKIRLVDLEADCKDWPVEGIFSLPADRQGRAWGYRGSQWYRQQMVQLMCQKANGTLYRRNGVYVVIGGAGKIGEAWTEYMISNYQANIIWIGRRPKDESIQAKLDRLETLGTAPTYIMADATKLESLQQAYVEVKKLYPHINGVIHAALVLSDQSIAEIEEKEFKSVLSSKIDVSVQIAEVFYKEDMDFVLFFSSLMSVTKAPRHSSYAAGCTFKDAFAYQLSHEWPCAVKIMNWGYWAESEANSYGVNEELMQTYLRLSEIGLGNIDPPEAMEALEILLAGPVDQIGLMKTTKVVDVEALNREELISVYTENYPVDIQNIKNILNMKMTKEIPTPVYSMRISDTEILPEKIMERLIFAVSQLLNVKIEDIDTDARFDDYGFDPTRLVRFISEINQEFGVELSASCFLECKNLNCFAEYLINEYEKKSGKNRNGLHSNDHVGDYCNEAMANSAVAYLEELLKHDPSVKINILEITDENQEATSVVLQKLDLHKEAIHEYCCAGISKELLMNMEEKNGQQYPYITYKVFNVEEEISTQDIKPGGYDILIAGNVLYNAKDTKMALRNAKAILRNNGLIILKEASSNNITSDLDWQEMLKSEGFKSVFAITSKAKKQGEQIIIAESDGVVRQKNLYRNNETSGSQDIKTVVPEPKNFMQKITAIDITQGHQDLAYERGIEFFKNLISETLKISISKIDPAESLDKYGIDSISVVQLTNKLREATEGRGDISDTLFFEHPTIDDLVDHFMSTQKETLLKLIGFEAHELNETVEETAKTPTVTARTSSKKTSRVAENVNIRTSEPQYPTSKGEDIAIIGVSGRYPNANNIQEFWANLRSGTDCIIEVPKERWDNSLYYDENKDNLGKTHCNWGGFISGVDQFDPLFFKMSPKEAEYFDPQERLFLETVWNLFEGFGYTKEALQNLYQGKVGVYVGAMHNHYPLIKSDLLKESSVSLSSYSTIPNRISRFFNFQGPSIAIDTACSSSAIAIHTACESLKRGECLLAVAGGVNLSIHPKKYIGFSTTRMIGSHIKSRSFGDGDGFLPAEAVGAVLLKPISKAIEDGDSILAVIKSTATNHGGQTNGFVPNPNAQVQLIEDNFKKSGIDPRTISYVEAAANGSALVDAIEMSALNKVFKKYMKDNHSCIIGSVKSNIGHAEAASGISQLTKMILQLQNKQIVPTIKAYPLNQNISFENSPLYLQQELVEWEQPSININGKKVNIPRRATISSFGAGGSNAHMILEEYIPDNKEKENTTEEKAPRVVVFSAKSPDRLKAVVQQILLYVEKKNGLRLADLAYTLQVGREAMEYRLALIANSLEELLSGMKDYLKAVEKGMEIMSLIPIFSGDIETSTPGIKRLLTGKSGDSVLRVLIEEKNLEKLALCWVEGSKIPWELLSEDEEVRRIQLPTYPFKYRRCWINPQSESSEEDRAVEIIGNINAVSNEGGNLKNLVIDIICNLLGMTPEEINLNKPLNQYGLDSIVAIQLFQQLQSRVNSSFNLMELKSCESIQDIITVLSKKSESISLLQEYQQKEIETAAGSKFPEIIHLNTVNKDRPIFWFHGGEGGVEGYYLIAETSQRSFYGIQARGWLTEHAPIQGVHAMADYYTKIIRSVQPEGPYDFGGYSFGGTLAYEVTRNMQEMGQKVNTIVMLDTISDVELAKNVSITQKATIMQTINMGLLSTIFREPEKLSKTLISREELDLEAEDDMFLKEMITLAKSRGLNKSESQLLAQISQSNKINQSYDLDKYKILPLPDPSAVTCYYFRNKSRLLFGELEPYFTISGNEISVTKKDYWKEWERQIPNFHMMDVASSNHFMLLSEPKSYEVINAFCERLYSKDGMNEDFLKSFIKKHKSIQKRGEKPEV